MKVMVIGIDGATFDVLMPLINEGKLPYLKTLIKEGTHGHLQSTIPPLSSAAWSTFQTGKNPGKNGIFDFHRNIRTKYACEPVNATFLKTKTLWSILSENGKRVGVINMLFTYPPEKVNGFIISGKETPGEDKEYTFPHSLKQEIIQFEPKYQVEPWNQISSDKKFLRNVPARLKLQERVHRYLFRKYQTDFFMNLFAVPDILHHFFWKHMDPSHPHYNEKEARKYLPLLEKCFQTLDEIIGRRVEMIDEDTVIMIMSDHGGGPLHKIVQLNRWLRKHGLLILKEGCRTDTSPVAKNLKAMMKRLYVYLLKYDAFGIRRKLWHIQNKKKMAFRRDAIDWSKTKAYAGRAGEHGIHCNLQDREGYGSVAPGREYEEVRDFIISGLSQLIDPASGCKVFERIYKREQVYKGPNVSSAPDIMLEFGDNPYEPGEALLGQEIFEEITHGGLSGKHRPNGILIVSGKGIKKGGHIQHARICDLAPTILYTMGEKIPSDMDGQVLLELFEESFIRNHVVEYDESDLVNSKTKENRMEFTDEETAEIQQRLRSLGYL